MVIMSNVYIECFKIKIEDLQKTFPKHSLNNLKNISTKYQI